MMFIKAFNRPKKKIYQEYFPHKKNRPKAVGGGLDYGVEFRLNLKLLLEMLDENTHLKCLKQ